MKISKLFHWLYALVMLLPIFAIGVTCGYAMFNKNAYKSNSSDNIIESQTQISNTGTLLNGQNYEITFDFSIGTTATNSAIYKYQEISFDWTDYGASSDYNYNGFMIYKGSSNYYIYLYENETQIFIIWTGKATFGEIFTFSLIPSIDIVQNGNQMLYAITKSFKQQTLDNVFYYAVDKVTESQLFSWAYNSFLAVPFTYITNLFGIPSTSIIIELLSYWLAISIIWLVFDLIMYVPLLVHRWIDKGVLE